MKPEPLTVRSPLLPLLLAALLLAGCAGGPQPLLERWQGRNDTAQASSGQPVVLRPANTVQSPAAGISDEDVFFALGEARIDSEALPKLAAHAARLKSDPKLCVTLVGHTDDLGSPAYNLAIAQQRVDAVFDALRGLGVSRNQLRRYPVGSEKAPAGCRQEACRSKLRRVEFQYAR